MVNIWKLFEYRKGLVTLLVLYQDYCCMKEQEL